MCMYICIYMWCKFVLIDFKTSTTLLYTHKSSLLHIYKLRCTKKEPEYKIIKT